MKIYLVGGAVRDELLNRPVKDLDYVVVGATPQQMLDLGYKQVGADFPVFLDEHGTEYALARTERKTGKGYQGFAVDFDPTITLADDLRRRDLTINAMAKDLETGEIVDPFNGLEDLKNHTLRHVSEAFAEDPLRVLRVARFKARYGYRIVFETVELMQKMVAAGEVDHLTPERVWVEVEKGLNEANPGAFITTLMVVDAWSRLFPGVRAGGALHKLHEDSDLRGFDARLMILFSETSEEVMEATLEKYRASTETVTLLRKFKLMQKASRVDHSTATELQLLHDVEAFRRPGLLEAVVEPAFVVDNKFGVFVNRVVKAYKKCMHVAFVSLSAEQKATLKGVEIGKAIDVERLKALS